MPCENCNVQFTVFRRKRTCHECKRYYCSNCLTTLKRSQTYLCERCAIFSKRPLLRSDLLQLKPKDLIFFLQSKHISTKGCVEKDELIKLVLNHVEQTDASGSSNSNNSQQWQQQQQNSQGSPTDDSAGNSLDNLRQTCQNFFFNITDNISDSLASFDGSKTNKPQQDNNNANNVNSQGNGSSGRRQRSQSATSGSSTATTPHIFDQPRVSKREIPTYASSLNSGATTTAASAPTTTTIIINERQASCSNRPTATTTMNSNNQSQSSNSDEQKTSTSSSLASPIVSMSSIASQAPIPSAPVEEMPNNLLEPPSNLDVPKLSDCECSDEELFANYSHARNSLTTTPTTTTSPVNQRQTTPNTIASPTPTAPLAEANQGGDEVSQSSFEELGAVGCSTEDSGGSSNTEAWQILEPQNENEELNAGTVGGPPNLITTTTTTTTPVIEEVEETPATARKKLLRRRSDRQRSSVSEELNSPVAETAAAGLVGHAESASTAETEFVGGGFNQPRRRSGTCRRCGKSNIRRYVEKMRQHLESAQMSEADIKRELSEFLAYLDEQTRSVDYSETEPSLSPLSNTAGGRGAGVGASIGGVGDSGNQIVVSPTATRPPFFIDFADDENDGIHVYGAEASSYSTEHNARFVNLHEFENVEDLESLTVKQLKEVLMLHRVDYKGCCEKQELLERVERLWKDLKASPAAEKLATDELCKICMDAPIDCVILECGHMATCTKCGKVLSECPICRQYIVRVVHTFRA